MENKKINFSRPLLGLDGTPYKDQLGNVTGETLGGVLASHLVVGAKGDALKLYSWAIKMHNNEDLEFDKADFIKLKDFISNCETMSILAKAQLLLLIEE